MYTVVYVTYDFIPFDEWKTVSPQSERFNEMVKEKFKSDTTYEKLGSIFNNREELYNWALRMGDEYDLVVGYCNNSPFRIIRAVSFDIGE